MINLCLFFNFVVDFCFAVQIQFLSLWFVSILNACGEFDWFYDSFLFKIWLFYIHKEIHMEHISGKKNLFIVALLRWPQFH